MDQTPSEIRAVAWVRAVRDAMYEETSHMGAEEFAAYVARKAAAVRTEDAARRPSALAAERGVEAVGYAGTLLARPPASSYATADAPGEPAA